MVEWSEIGKVWVFMTRRRVWILALLSLVLLGGCKAMLTEDEYWPEAAKVGKAFVVTFDADQRQWPGTTLSAYYWPAGDPLPVPSIDSSSYYYSYYGSTGSGWVALHFNHWNTDPSGFGTTYYPGETIANINSDLTLYAICQ